MNKKVLSLLAVGAITTSMFSGVVANATTATGGKNVEVTYNNQNTVTDPDNPGAPQWQVAIPSGINFTEDKKTVDVGIELQNMEGESITSQSDLSVNVKIKSQNGYTLKKGGSSSVGYSVAYGSKTMEKQANTDEVIGNLVGNVGENKIDGVATLGSDVATELGRHVDTLTYTVQKNGM